MAASKFFLLWILMVIFTVPEMHANNSDTCNTPECEATSEWFLNNMDSSVRPCSDFYKFACGNFANVYKIPPYENNFSSFAVRQNKIIEETKALLMQDDGELAEAVQAAKRFFEICIDKERIEKNGDVSLLIELTKVGLPLKPPYNTPPPNDTNLSKLLAEFHRYSVVGKFLFSISVKPDFKNRAMNYLTIGYPPAVSRTLQNEVQETILDMEMFGSHTIQNGQPEKEKEEFRKNFKEYMLNVVHHLYELVHFKYTKVTREIVERRTEDVIDFLLKVEETKMLEKPQEDDTRATYLTMDELQKITDKILKNSAIQINWYEYVETYTENVINGVRQLFKGGEKVMIINMKQLKALLQIVSETQPKVFYSAIWWSTISDAVSLFTKPLQQFKQEFEKKNSKKDSIPREVICIKKVANTFRFLVGYRMLLSENHTQKKNMVLEMLDNLRKSFTEMIENTNWLDDSTKMAALNKLTFISNIVSFVNWMADPNKLNNMYSGITLLRESYYSSISESAIVGRESNIQFLGQKNDFSNASMSPTNPAEVNAYYDFSFNAINIPIGILGFPFYDLGLECLNYGAIGLILGHELGHGFDNRGKMFNHNGEFSDWWEKEASDKYKKRSKCYVRAYQKFYYSEAKKHVDGWHTLGENIADNTGLKVAIMAYRKYVKDHGKELKLVHFDYLSHEQLLTMAFANLWCINAEPAYYKFKIGGDEHAPPEARVRGVAKNSHDFAEIWQCQPKERMNPAKKCQIWD